MQAYCIQYFVESKVENNLNFTLQNIEKSMLAFL